MAFEQSSGSPHHFLSQLVGGWAGTTKLWIEPDVLTDESSIVGSVQLILDGRFALFLYQSSVDLLQHLGISRLEELPEYETLKSQLAAVVTTENHAE